MTGVLRRVPAALAWVAVFAIAFALVEACVVIYLRALYYPGGFSFPLREMPPGFLRLEIAREAATILMLLAVGVIAGARPWEKFSYFIVAFGLWDIMFYVWLLVTIGWPASPAEWDILFLIPVPWIGPVIAPVLVSLLMIVCGGVMLFRSAAQKAFRPGALSWVLGVAATVLVLWSFMSDTDAGLRGAPPAAYHYELLALGLAGYTGGFVLACRAPAGDASPG
ncbi:MAG TPA: hypothetical protein VML00_10420 [Bacteroidota bacterium]|nr:hypothetical protein [Bacteroidota bacterium]